MPTPEKFLDALKELIYKHMLEALNPGKGKQTEFGYGEACGILQGLQHAERLWNDQTAQEEERDGSDSRQTKR